LSCLHIYWLFWLYLFCRIRFFVSYSFRWLSSVCPPNKGNTTAIIRTHQIYYKKKNLLLDKAYKKFDKDPTNTIAQNTKILMEKNNIPNKIKSTLKPINPLPSRLYGLPKVHKLNIPFRPIVSTIHSPIYNLSRTNTTIDVILIWPWRHHPRSNRCNQ